MKKRTFQIIPTSIRFCETDPSVVRLFFPENTSITTHAKYHVLHIDEIPVGYVEYHMELKYDNFCRERIVIIEIYSIYWQQPEYEHIISSLFPNAAIYLTPEKIKVLIANPILVTINPWLWELYKNKQTGEQKLIYIYNPNYLQLEEMENWEPMQ